MKQHNVDQLIEDILEQSSHYSQNFQSDIRVFIEAYHDQIKEREKLEKQNEFFLKKWDRRNIQESEKDTKTKKMIEQQSRLAAMGEMIDAVAHQWKQPLNAISMLTDLLQEDFRHDLVDQQYIDELDESVHMQIDHMVTTLQEFRNFLRPSTKNEQFTFLSVLDNVRVLMKDELIAQNLHLNVEIDGTINYFGNKNEFKHLFINLINNSIDALNERKISNRELYVRAYQEERRIYIEVEDNAGGIPEHIIHDIFKPNITTKPEGKGTGIGLYMSYQIVKKYNGYINAHNSELGAFFTITLQQPTI